MQWWTDFNEWLYSDAGWRVISTVIVPFLAIVLSAVIASLIARGFVRKILAREDREDRAAAVAIFIEVARQSTQWANLPTGNQDHAQTLASAASVRLRLLPSHGAAAAAEWAEHQIQKIKDNSASFSMQSEQDYVEFRDRLTEWQHKPKAARRLFAVDLAEFKAADTAVEEDLVERQRQWAAEQAAAEQLAAERAAADAAAANAIGGVNSASASAFTGPIATVEPSDEPAPRLRSSFEAPEIHETESTGESTGAVYPITPTVDTTDSTIFTANESAIDSDAFAAQNETITFEPAEHNGTQVFASSSESPRPTYNSQEDTGAEFEQGFRERLEAENSSTHSAEQASGAAVSEGSSSEVFSGEFSRDEATDNDSADRDSANRDSADHDSADHRRADRDSDFADEEGTPTRAFDVSAFATAQYASDAAARNESVSENSTSGYDSAAGDGSVAGVDSAGVDSPATEQRSEWAAEQNNEEPPPLQEPAPAPSFHDFSGAVPAVDYSVADDYDTPSASTEGENESAKAEEHDSNAPEDSTNADSSYADSTQADLSYADSAQADSSFADSTHADVTGGSSHRDSSLNDSGSDWAEFTDPNRESAPATAAFSPFAPSFEPRDTEYSARDADASNTYHSVETPADASNHENSDAEDAGSDHAGFDSAGTDSAGTDSAGTDSASADDTGSDDTWADNSTADNTHSEHSRDTYAQPGSDHEWRRADENAAAQDSADEPDNQQATQQYPPHLLVEPTGPITTAEGAPAEVVEATIDEEKNSPFSRPRFFDS